jgi:hypothetical protein
MLIYIPAAILATGAVYVCFGKWYDMQILDSTTWSSIHMQKQMVHGNAQDGVGKYFVSASKKSR